MRSITIPLLALLLAPLARAEDEGKPGPVDIGKVLRGSKEFREKCRKYRIGFEEGKVTAVGEIIYRGGGPCEYAVGVWPTKPHETIVLLDDGPWKGEGARPRAPVEGLAVTLNNALLAAGFEKGTPFDWNNQTGEVFPPTGQVVHVYCEWKDAKGQEKRARMSDWLWNFKTSHVMEPGHFVYTGSLIIDEGPPTNRKWLGAEVDGLIVAVLNTGTALIDNTEDGGLDNGAYEAIPIRIPPLGTRVRVVFSAEPLPCIEFEPLKLNDEIRAARKRYLEEKKRRDAEESKGGKTEEKEKDGE